MKIPSYLFQATLCATQARQTQQRANTEANILPRMEGVVKDAQAMYRYLIERGYSGEEISLYGHSLGGTIALE